MALIQTVADGHVTTITLNRPEKLNAFAGTMRDELYSALEHAERDASCRVIVLTGAGRAFCAGGDVEAMAELQRSNDVPGFRKLLETGAKIVTLVATMNKPVIASINGVAAGAGCSLALACDYRIAADDARIGQTFVRIGLHPDWGGTWLLPRIVGRSHAFELMMSGRLVEAAEAKSIGLVDRVVPSAELAAATGALARTIAEASPVATSAINVALAASDKNDLRAQLALEIEHQLRAFTSAEAVDRIEAFLAR